MDWKTYYRREIEAPAGRRAVDRFLKAGEDDELISALGDGAIVSFPHTALAFAGPMQARVVSALYRSGSERVVALGVLHAGGCRAYQVALDGTQAIDVRRAALLDVAGGTVLSGSSVDTPFGGLPLVKVSECDDVPVRVDRAGLLADEFSLDTFFAMMRRAADVFDAPPIPVLPVFVGPTRDPIDGSFRVAERLAEWVRRQCADGRSTARVTTGDLAHYGTAYGSPDAVPADDLDRRLCLEVERTLDAALVARDWARAHRLSVDVLRNDQREILPVISGILGAARHRIVGLTLSDYAPILDVLPPSVVATALVIYEPSS